MHAILEAIDTGGMFNAINLEDGDKVDFRMLTDDPFDASRFARRVTVDVFGTSLKVSGPEDTILMVRNVERTMTKWARLRDDGVVSLSLYRSEDAAVMMSGDADSEHRQRFEFPNEFVPSVAHSEQVIEQWEYERAEGTRFVFATRDASTGELLGGCELLRIASGKANVSFWTYPSHRGLGVASRAVKLICDLAREELELRELEIATDPDHEASRKVALRAGFRAVGQRGPRTLYVRQLSA